MSSPRDRYNTDSHYHALVNLMESFIHTAQFTPSEMREAAVLACIHYEIHSGRGYRLPLSEDLEEAFQTLSDFRKKNPIDQANADLELLRKKEP